MPASTHSPQTTGETLDFAVITTAALPWRTGPAYLSLWHACGLAALGYRVLYRIPRLSPDSQRRLWGKVRFADDAAHFAWLAEEAGRLGCPALPRLASYPGRYSATLRSIVPLRPVVAGLPPCRALILEEPEHLAWHPATPPRHRIAAGRVVGVVMTNYPHYVAAAGWPGARLAAQVVERGHRWLIRRHTDLALSISPAEGLEWLFRPQREARITGVLSPYATVPPVTAETRGVYFLGRLVWDKGLDQVIELARRSAIPVDLYGDGPDAAAIEARAREVNAPIRLFGPHPSPWEWLPRYRAFLNPSRSEVLCTATADALVAGRHVILPDCPANRPFLGYPNAHPFDDLEGALRALERAMGEPPAEPTTIRHDFDWMNACSNLARIALE
ncbi:glycosyltransferase [Endothiovibrio diazotrophicus]